MRTGYNPGGISKGEEMQRIGTPRVSITFAAFTQVVLAASLLLSACAASSGGPRPKLADGSTVPAGASFKQPTPLDGMPTKLIGEIGSSGVRGAYVADLVVGTDGSVGELRLVRGVSERAAR
jgi:hypothetical protein